MAKKRHDQDTSGIRAFYPKKGMRATKENDYYSSLTRGKLLGLILVPK